MFTALSVAQLVSVAVLDRTWHRVGKYVLVKDDEVLDQLVDESLILDLVSLLWNGYQGWSEADGQVVGVHEVLVAEL